MISINFIAVFFAAIVAFIIGFLLHGPVLGKLWMRLANIHPTGKEKISDMYGQMIWNFIVNFITASGIAVLVAILSGSTFGSDITLINGLIVGLIVWIFFIGTTTSIEVIWMGKSFKLWLYEMFCSLVVMITLGLIIGSSAVSPLSYEVKSGQQFNDKNNQIRFDAQINKWVDNYGICHTCTPENGFPMDGSEPVIR